MTYVVHYFDAQGALAYSDMNPRSFEEAKGLVEGAIDQGTAVRAEVRDNEGKLVFHRPMALKAAANSDA